MDVIGLCMHARTTFSFTTRTNKREVNNSTPYLGLLRPFLENSGVSPGIWCLGVLFLCLFCADNRVCMCMNVCVCVFRLQSPLHEQRRRLPQTCSEEDFKIKAPTLSAFHVQKYAFSWKNQFADVNSHHKTHVHWFTTFILIATGNNKAKNIVNYSEGYNNVYI